MNIFVLMDDPVAPFNRLKPLVAADHAAAYREVRGTDYTVLFPPGRKEFRIL